MRLRGFIVFLWVKLFNLSINHAYLSLVCLYISNSMKQEIYSLWISRSFQFKCLYRYARMYMCRYKCIFVVKIVVFSLHEDCKIRHAINKFIKQVLEQMECLLLATRHSWRHYLSANTRIMKSVVLLKREYKINWFNTKDVFNDIYAFLSCFYLYCKLANHAKHEKYSRYLIKIFEKWISLLYHPEQSWLHVCFKSHGYLAAFSNILFILNVSIRIVLRINRSPYLKNIWYFHCAPKHIDSVVSR